MIIYFYLFKDDCYRKANILKNPKADSVGSDSIWVHFLMSLLTVGHMVLEGLLKP